MTTDIATLGLAVHSDRVTVAKDRLDDLTKSAGAAETATSKVGKAAIAMVAAFATWEVVSGTIGRFISATSEAEAAQAKLSAVLKATGGQVGYTAEHLSTMASELQKVTVFGDEAIIGAQTMLLTFRNIGGEVFPRATEAALDLATTLGGDLNGAAIQLGKALNDPIQGISSLARTGVQFSDSQKEMIKSLVETNRLGEAQAIILGEIETQMGGTARSARQTLGGSLQALGEAFGDLFEVSGPGAEGMRQSVEDLIAILQDPSTMAAINTFGSWLLGTIGEVIKVFATLVNSVKDFVTWLQQTSQQQIETSASRQYSNPNAIPGLAAGPADTGAIQMRSFDHLPGVNAPDEAPTPATMPPGFRPTPSESTFHGGAPVSESAKAATEAYEKLIDTAQKRIDQLQVEATTLGMTGVAAMEYANYQGLLNQAIASEIELTPERLAQLEELAAKQTDLQLTLEGLQIAMENRTPWESFQEELAKTIELFDRGKISADDFISHAAKAADKMVSSYASAATNVIDNVEKLTDALGLQGKEAFEVQKALSIARAVIAGGESVMNSFNAGTAIGGPPVGFAFAALAGAAAIAQVAAIASTSYNAKSVPNAMGGASTAGDVSVPTPQGKTTTVNIVGDMFNRETVERVAKLMGELAGDGVEIRSN